VQDRLSSSKKTLRAPVVVNATGAWGPRVAAMAGGSYQLRPGKGVHIVYSHRISNYGISLTGVDGRQMFLMPHENGSIVGTTDDDYYGDLDHPRATEDEVKRREFSLATARARALATAAAVSAAAEAVRQAGTDLDILTVRSPRDGRLLQVNLREGEFAAAKSAEPLMLLGDVDRFQVRAEVDEQDAVLIRPDQPAVASLKGHSELRVPLQFVRIEPYVVPKRSLTGDSLERVDTRVLQVVYAFERPAFPIYVGQQVDVFIQRPEASSSPSATPESAPPPAAR